MSVPTSSATHHQNLLENDTTSLSMNSESKSFCIVSMMSVSFGMCLW